MTTSRSTGLPDSTVGEPGVRGDVERVLPDGYWPSRAREDEIASAARSRRVPLTLTAVTAVVGACTWGAAAITDTLAGTEAGSAVAAAVCAGSVVAVPVARAVLRGWIAAAGERTDGDPDRWVRRWWVGTTCAACWVDAVTAVGNTMTGTGAIAAGAFLTIGSWLIGSRWWAAHEVPDPWQADDTPDQQPAVPAVATRVPQIDPRAAEAQQIEREWAARVAAGRRPVAPGSALHDRQALPHGWRWTVHLDRDESTTCTALEGDEVRADVAMRLGMSATHVILERLDHGNREDRATLTVVTRDVLAAGVPYRGPRYSQGVLPIGDYTDGTPDASWRLHDDTGVLCGLATGGQGSGKSALLAAIGMGARRSGEWVVLFGDGDDGGNSSLLLAEVAHDFARGPAEVLQQLEGLEATAQVRGVLMGTLTTGRDGRPTPITGPGQRPVTKMLPCPAFPGIVWIIDEFYRLANDPHLQRVNFVDRVEAIVRIMRKYGGCVIVGTQSALGDDFDGNSALRGMLASGNSAVMRTKNKSEQGIVTDGFAPSQLPRGGGYAFLGEGERRAMIRTEHPDGMPPWAAKVIRYGRPDTRSWAAFRRYRTVRELDVAADYAEQVAKLAAFDEAVATGAPLPWSTEARKAGANGPAAAVPMSIGGFTVPTLADIIPLRPAEPEAALKENDEPQPEPLPLSKNTRTVLDDLVQHPGPQRSADIITRTGLRDSAVSKALRELVGAGLAHRPSGVRGVHAAGPEPREINSKTEEAI